MIPSAELAQKLLQIKAIKLSPQRPFVWASGIISPIYCDNRVSLSHPAVRDMIKLGYSALAEQLGDFDCVVGVATAGIPHAAILADHLHKPMAYVRATPKSHGRQNQIEGEVVEGQSCIVIEDLISTGGSSIAVVEILRESGMKVKGVLAIFTYGFEDAIKNFEKIDCPFLTITDYNTLLEEAIKANYIESKYLKILTSWKQDPKNWNNPS